MTRFVRLAWLIGLAAAPFGVSAQPVAPAAAPPAAGPSPLESLITATPAKGYDLAIRLARRVVPMMQRDASVRGEVRQHYARDSAELTEASHAVATRSEDASRTLAPPPRGPPVDASGPGGRPGRPRRQPL